eukprot:11867117-Karenia_brevis.AAC.1
MDRHSPESGARYANYVAEESVYDNTNMYAKAIGFGLSWHEAQEACDMALVLVTIANGLVPCDDHTLGNETYTGAACLREHRQTMLIMRWCPIYQA